MILSKSLVEIDFKSLKDNSVKKIQTSHLYLFISEKIKEHGKVFLYF